jgi:serine/threonine-protein kinase
MGTGLPGFSGDGGPAWLAALSRPAGVTLRRGEILVSDPGNHRIRRIDADGLASTWLGPDPAIDPPLTAPTRLVADDLTGLVFFSEPATGLVRCVDIEGRVVTVLGGGSLEARDTGPGVSGRDIRLQVPAGLTLDPSGRLLVTDAAANVVWQVDLETGWMARAVAGTGQAGGLGDGGPARLAQLDGPVDVQMSSEGAIWVVEESGHRVRRIRPDGVIERVAGTGLPGRDPDGLQALRSRLNGPTSVLPGPDGSALVADRGNARLVRISPEGDLSTMPTEISEPAILAKGTDPEVLAVDPSRHELHVLRPELQGP